MKLEKVRPTFSSFNATPVKITKQLIIMVGAPWSNLFDIFFITDSTGAFCVWVKALSYDFSEKWTLNSNILVTAPLISKTTTLHVKNTLFWILAPEVRPRNDLG